MPNITKSLFKFFANHKNLFRVSSIDALNYCLLAEGKIDIIVESGLKKVDIDPLIPIIKNSGGVITNWKGKEDIADRFLTVLQKSFKS